MIALLPALLLAVPHQAGTAPRAAGEERAEAWLELPEGPLERTWAAVGPDTAPWFPEKSRPEGGAGADPLYDEVRAANAQGRWLLWGLALQSLGEGDPKPDQVRRLRRELALLAAEDRRGADAYAWLGALGPGDPEAVAGVMPYLFPGVHPAVALGPGGRPSGLGSGARFAPLLPPGTAEEEAQGIFWREAFARGLTVDDTTFDLRLKLDGSGVLVEFENVVGPAVEVSVVLPAPDGFRLKSLYRDWELEDLPEGESEDSVDWAGVPIALTVKAGDLDPSVFARMARTRSRMPGAPGAALPAVLAEQGFELRVPASIARPGADALSETPDEPDEPEEPDEWDWIRQAFQRASGVRCALTRVEDPAAPPSVSGALAPYRIDFTRADDPVALRRRITSALEARVRGGS